MRTVVRVISLPKAQERRARFAKSLESFPQLDWAFFDAGQYTAPGISYDPRNALIAQGRKLTEGEVGCFVSHYRLWRSFLESDHQQMMILEDDAFVDWQAILPLLDRDLSSVPFLRLYTHRPARSREIGWVCGYRLVHFLDYCYGVQAYIVTREGARMFAEAGAQLERPIDDFMDRSWAHGVPNLCIFPFPVLELAGPSTIGSVARYEPVTLSREEQLKRLAYRAQDKLTRLAYTARELSPVARTRLETVGIAAAERLDSY